LAIKEDVLPRLGFFNCPGCEKRFSPERFKHHLYNDLECRKIAAVFILSVDQTGSFLLAQLEIEEQKKNG
jgi:hypothetical protein